MVGLALQSAEVPAVLQQLLRSEYAFLALFAVFVLEGAMLLYVVPSEALVPGSILLIGDTEQLLSVDNLAIVAVAVIGATVGQYALFVLARRGGREYLLEKRWFRVREAHLTRFDEWFERWGAVVVPVSNTLLFTRGMLTVPAGFSTLDARSFLVLSAIGTLSFQLILAALAFGALEAV